MAQFGAGSELSAQCLRAPTPDGWRPWTDEDGPIPNALTARAQAMVSDTTLPLGVTESYPLPGVTTLIRLEPHLWMRDVEGNLVQGCFRAASVYLPSTAPEGAGITPPVTSKVDKIIGVLTVVSLAVGTVATLASWGNK